MKEIKTIIQPHMLGKVMEALTAAVKQIPTPVMPLPFVIRYSSFPVRYSPCRRRSGPPPLPAAGPRAESGEEGESGN